MTDASLDDDQIGKLADEFVERFRRGDRPSIAEYCERHPELDARIRSIFPSLVMFEEFAPGSQSSLDESLFSADGRRHAAPVQIGDYRILRIIGRGGMGVVYEAVQESLGRHVALKVLRSCAALDEESLQRFRGEARAAARLHHTNIVPVFEVGQDQGFSFIAMQFIRGKGLDSVLADLQRMRSAHRSSKGDTNPVLEDSLSRGIPSSDGTLHERAPIADSMPTSDQSDSVAVALVRGRFGDMPCEGSCESLPITSGEGEASVRSSADPAQSGVPDASESTGGSLAGSSDFDHREKAPVAARDLPSDSSSISQANPRRYFRSIAQLGVQVAEALEYAHRRGVIHRDIKPSNLLLDTSGVVWITDFGLAKTEGDDHTHTGDIVGTVRYMAPERFEGRSDPRNDVYSLGATLYELLTLRPVFDSTERALLIRQVMHSEPPRPRKIDPRIPRDLETIVLKAMAREPAARFVSAGQMAEDLRRFLSDQPIEARRSWVWERTWRWCVRNPAVASLTMFTILVFLLGLSGVLWKWREAEQARHDERLARKDADAGAEEVRQGLGRLKASNSLLDLGRVCVDNRRWDDADAAFTRALELRPDHVQAWEDRGHLLYARLGLWELAAEDLARAFELQRPTVANRWRSHALLRVYMGDKDGYRRVCAEMQKQFARAYSPVYASDLVRTLALVPDAGGIGESSVKLAEAVVTSHPKHATFLYVLATTKCRAGEYQEAIKRCHESIAAAPQWSAKALNYPVLAIAHSKLGQDDESRRALDLLTAVMSDWTQQMVQFGPDFWVTSLGATGYWPVSVWDWLECQLYGREAQRLLGLEPVEDPRLHLLRARAFAGLRQSVKADAEYSIALKSSPDDAQVQLEAHRNRAYIHVSRREFVRAATEFAKASALAPDDSDLWRFQALAHLGASDFDGYREVCRRMIARFHDTQDAAVAYDVVDACVLREESLDDMSQLIPLAKVGAAWYVGAIRVLGAANYRAGRFSEAVRCYQDASNMTRLRARDWEFLAMAHEQLGQVAEARQCLAEAIRWIDEANRQELDDLTGVRPVWEGWHETIDVPMLLEEVKALLGRGQLKFPASR